MSKEKKTKDPITATKRALYFLLANGCLWVWCSYLLAFLDKPVIAETLSQVAITEILGVFFVYAVKSLFENLSMHNTWPDGRKQDKKSKTSKDDQPDLSNWDNAKGND